MHISINRRNFLVTVGATAAGPVLAQNAGNVVVYTSNNQQAVQSITDVARAKLPNLKFNFVTGGSGVLLKRMETEQSAPQADLFWSSSANTLGAFKPLFEPYRSPEAASIPASLAEPGNLWTAAPVRRPFTGQRQPMSGGPCEDRGVLRRPDRVPRPGRARLVRHHKPDARFHRPGQERHLAAPRAG